MRVEYSCKRIDVSASRPLLAGHVLILAIQKISSAAWPSFQQDTPAVCPKRDAFWPLTCLAVSVVLLTCLDTSDTLKKWYFTHWKRTVTGQPCETFLSTRHCLS